MPEDSVLYHLDKCTGEMTFYRIASLLSIAINYFSVLLPVACVIVGIKLNNLFFLDLGSYDF